MLSCQSENIHAVHVREVYLEVAQGHIAVAKERGEGRQALARKVQHQALEAEERGARGLQEGEQSQGVRAAGQQDHHHAEGVKEGRHPRGLGGEEEGQV